MSLTLYIHSSLLHVSATHGPSSGNTFCYWGDHCTAHFVFCALRHIIAFAYPMKEINTQNRYSDCLRVGRPRGRISSPGMIIIFSSPYRPDRLWGPPILLSNGYRVLFPRALSGRGVKLTTHLQLVPRSRKCGSIHPSPYALAA
jgi:hypothetical protein